MEQGRAIDCRHSTRSGGFWVTCYTDASFRPSGAGWGVWLRSVLGRVVRQGPCPPYVKSALEAELAAIFAGVYLAWQTWRSSVRGIVVRTDCQTAIDWLSLSQLSAKMCKKWPGAARLHSKIRSFVRECGIELDMRWVKGHQRTNTTQSYLNNACDKLAGRVSKSTQLQQRRHGHR
jgi:ribonuclease HI